MEFDLALAGAKLAGEALEASLVSVGGSTLCELLAELGGKPLLQSQRSLVVEGWVIIAKTIELA